jgi:hypothetical protein
MDKLLYHSSKMTAKKIPTLKPYALLTDLLVHLLELTS